MRKLLLMITLPFILIGCDSGSKAPKYLSVISNTPANEAVEVGYNQPITVKFSEKIDEDKLINTDANLKSLLKTKGIIAVKPESTDELPSVTAQMVLEGKASLVWEDSGKKIDITSFEWSGTGDNRTLEIIAGEDTIKYTKRNLKDAELDQAFQNIITVADASGSKLPISVKVDNDKLIITPTNYYSWETAYTLAVKATLMSVNNRSLNEDFSMTFTTEVEPTPVISTIFPTGTNANPMKNIYFKTNFDIQNDSYLENLKVYKVSGTNEALVQGSLNYSDQMVTFTPIQDLDYSQKYRVIANGSDSKINGSIGQTPSVTLNESSTWNFTTSAPKIASFSPASEGSSNSYQVAITKKILIGFNFRPETSSVNESTILITDNDNNVVSVSQYKVTGTQVEISAALNYGKIYTVVVTPQVVADVSSEVHISSNQTFTFSTQKRKVLSTTPGKSERGVDKDSLKIEAVFNFDVDPTSLNRNSFSVSTNTKSLKGAVSYKSLTRTATFTIDSTELPLDFNTVVYVEIKNSIQDVNGERISKSYSWDFTLLNEALTVTSVSPVGSRVSADSTIQIKLNRSLGGLKEDGSLVEEEAFQVEYFGSSRCSGEVEGDVRWNGSNILYFDPNFNLKSDCSVRVYLNQDILGEEGERQEGNYSYTFSTDYLTVQDVSYATYSTYSVPTDTSIEIEFSHEVRRPLSLDFVLYKGDCGYPSETVSTDLYHNDDTVTLQPYSDLDPGQRYCVLVEDAEATTGEFLLEPREYEFTTTTSITNTSGLNVVDYGPRGNLVSTLGDFFVLFNTTAEGLYGFSWTADLRDSSGSSIPFSTYEDGDEIGIRTLSYLEPNRIYFIEFNLSLPDGTFESVEWTILTDSY